MNQQTPDLGRTHTSEEAKFAKFDKKCKNGKGNKRNIEEDASIERFKRNLSIQSVARHQVSKIEISLNKDWISSILNK